MKLIIIVAIATFLFSCGIKKHPKCDAYGKTEKIERDLKI